MKKIIMVAPHLSTGGMPQYLTKQIEHMLGEYEVYCVEWSNITGGVLVVQRNRIHNMIGERLITLDDKNDFIRIVEEIGPEILHFQEIPDTFVDRSILDQVYADDRKYKIVVTTHSSGTNPSKLKYTADHFILVSEWSRRRFVEEFGDERCSVWEYPVTKQIYDKELAKQRMGFDPEKMHVLHVGLFTPGKNQRLIVDVARKIEETGINKVHFHFVGNQADNFRDYWEPLMQNIPSNCTWHGERNDVEEFYKAADVFIFPSLYELNPLSLIEAQSFGLPLIITDLETYEGRYGGMAEYIDNDVTDCVSTIVRKVELFENNKKTLYDLIETKNDVLRVVDPTIVTNFINGPYVQIFDAPDDVFDVTFIDEKTGIVHFTSEVGNGCWAKSTLEYAVDWLIRIVRRSDGKVFESRFDPSEKKVFVCLDSKSVGDTLAWFPQVERFRKRWGGQVVCSTFWNDQFEANYPEITFVPPGSVVHGIYAMFIIGWFFDGEGYNTQKHPRDFRNFSLAQTASDVLGLDFQQSRALLVKPEVEKVKRVGIGFHSTAQTKYWNNPDGWQELTNFFVRMGYEVVIMSNEGDGYMGNRYPTGVTQHAPGDFEALKAALLSCEIFVGLGSGLSWLAWSLGIRTVLISGFSTPVSEFEGEDVIRIFNPDVCNGCYNRYRFNPGDWNWCPDHKDTERQFECTKSIAASSVISKIVEKGWVDFS